MFSVVIPLYNKAHTIEKTLSSVLSQTFTQYEIIVVNDGSTDNGVEVVKNFSNDPRIKIIDQKNQGVSVARNNGVAMSKYDYIAFLDGDDEWDPHFLEKMKEATEKYPQAGMLGTSSLHIDVVTGETFDSTLLRYKDKIQLVEYFENPTTMSHTSATVVSKKVFNQVDPNGNGFPVGMKCCEDWSCFFRVALRAPVVYVGIPLGIRNNNVQGQITGWSEDELFKLIHHVTDFYNLTFYNWMSSKEKNRLFPIFLKYDIRHRFLRALKYKKYKTLDFLLNNLDPSLLNIFFKFELILYKNLKLKYISILFIYFTKVIWRTHRFPIAGKN